jgi:hypothetical protein
MASQQKPATSSSAFTTGCRPPSDLRITPAGSARKNPQLTCSLHSPLADDHVADLDPGELAEER